MIIDLSLALDRDTPVYPGDRRPESTQLETVERDGHAKRWIAMTTHTGTHVDAPAHMVPGGKTLSDFPIETFVGPCVTFDVRGQREVTHDLAGVSPGDIVFFLMDHAAVISEVLARSLVGKGVRMVGVNAMSPDRAPYPVHKILLPHDILIVENLMNLERIAWTRCTAYVLPLKLTGADGAPCRVIANIK